MQKMHTKTIKSLGIACIIISSILLALSIVGIIASLIGSAAIGSYADDYLYYQGNGGHHGYYYYYDDDIYDLYGYGSSAAGVQFALILTVLLCVFAAICCAVSLIASIMVFKNAYKLEKYGLVFGWSIAGAIVGVFGSGMILTALFIIIAVFTNMDRKLYMSGQCQNMAGANSSIIPASPTAPVMPASGASVVAAATPSIGSASTGVAATAATATPTSPAAPAAPVAPATPGMQSAQPAQSAQASTSQAPTAQVAATAQTASAQSGSALSPESSDTVEVVEGIIANDETAAPANGAAAEVPVKIDLEPKDYVVEVASSGNPDNPEIAIIDTESDVSIATEAGAASTDADIASGDKPNA